MPVERTANASIVERTEKYPEKGFQPNGRLSLHG
jgi:hypothetical protein